MLDPHDINCHNCKQNAKSIFCALKSDELDLVNQSKQCRVYQKGEVIFQEGAGPKGIYCIESGKVKVSQLGLDGKDQILHLAKDGDVMGYRATLSGDLFSSELKKIETNLTKITQRPVKDRIAQSLLLLKDKYGLEADESTINVTVKREEIANLAGTTRETATRVLYHFQDEKVIELIGKKIKILNVQLLIEESNILD